MSSQIHGNRFVQLHRTFRELTELTNTTDESEQWGQPFASTSINWNDLITGYRTIILSEAGAGKTSEIRQIANSLQSDGKPAFFLRLEHISNNFEDAFEVGTHEGFQDWLSSGEEGWLLLDSIDEARLHSPNDFELAIRKIGRTIAVAKNRSHIFLTGRISAWRPKTDLELCTYHLRMAPIANTVEESDTLQSPNYSSNQNIHVHRGKEKDVQNVFKIVSLNDLNKDQVRIFASSRELSNPDELIKAIERADAWAYTLRPQDLEELIEFWVDKNRIGTRLELMQNSIDRRLSERAQKHADARPLSALRAREGARLIAAASTLTQHQTIHVPDGVINQSGISVRKILPHWDDQEQAILLSRPIFDEAIYGTVRFYHRSVREYLTAEWLAELLKHATSRRSIESLLFRNQYGIEVIVPTMRSILPWLAIFDEKVRDRLCRISPEILLEEGDPNALPSYIRKAILIHICKKIESGASENSSTSIAAIQRFSNSDLTNEIRSLLNSYSDSDEVREFLMTMVLYGEIRLLRDETKAVAFSSRSSINTRIAAINALRVVGTESDMVELRSKILSETQLQNRDLLGELLTEIQPGHDTINWALAALEKVEGKEPFSVDYVLSKAINEFVQFTPLDLLPKLIRGFNLLMQQPPFINGSYCEVSIKNSWLIEAASLGIERLIRSNHQYALSEDTLGILYKLKMVREWDGNTGEIRAELDQLVPNWPTLNRSLFWYDVHQTRVSLNKTNQIRLTYYRQASQGSLWKFSVNDFPYLCEEISNRGQDDKLVALSLAIDLYLENERPVSWHERLSNLISGNAELSNRFESMLTPHSADIVTSEEKQWRKQTAKAGKQKKINEEQWKREIQNNIETLRDPKFDDPTGISNNQWYLHQKCREKIRTSNRWSAGNWQDLASEFGVEVAQAYRDGAVLYWRKYRPLLISEGAPSNSTSSRIIFGLTGLEIEAREIPLWAERLTNDEVELACRYAAHELNGFPAWFKSLFDIHPDLVEKFLVQEIRYELSNEKLEEDSNYILSDICWYGEWAWDNLAPKIYDILLEKTPENSSNLRKLLSILVGSNFPDSKIEALVSNKIIDNDLVIHAEQWFAVWMGSNPERAIPILEDYLEKISGEEEKNKFAMSFVTNVQSGRRTNGLGIRPNFKSPSHLKRIYLLIHKYIRQEDDVKHANGVAYSPGLRDDAEDARESFIEALFKIPGKEAFLALDEISRIHPYVPARSWIAIRAKRKAEQDADLLPWSVEQVNEFHNHLEKTPANHQELAEHAMFRFLDIKDMLENADSSIAGILKTVTQETELRKYLGHELREKAFGRYTIVQEEELADAKKPDLRFHGIGFDAPVPVELKLADNWTGPRFFERLENQLCGDYLRDIRSGIGIFVLVYRGERKFWQIPETLDKVDFIGLINLLQAHWEKISVLYPKIEKIDVIGIDLTKRFS